MTLVVWLTGEWVTLLFCVRELKYKYGIKSKSLHVYSNVSVQQLKKLKVKQVSITTLSFTFVRFLSEYGALGAIECCFFSTFMKEAWEDISDVRELSSMFLVTLCSPEAMQSALSRGGKS